MHRASWSGNYFGEAIVSGDSGGPRKFLAVLHSLIIPYMLSTNKICIDITLFRSCTANWVRAEQYTYGLHHQHNF